MLAIVRWVTGISFLILLGGLYCLYNSSKLIRKVQEVEKGREEYPL